MRYVHVHTSCGCAMPMLAKAADVETFMQRAEAQLAKGRKKPQQTTVGKYVDAKAPKLARAVRKVLKAWAAEIAPKVAELYAKKLEKDDSGTRERILSIISELNNEVLGEDLAGALEGAMLAAFKRAAAVGATQVGFDVADITQQVDQAAVKFAAQRGGELIKDLAGTTDKDLKSLLEQAVEDGLSADELEDAVADLGAFGEVRAEMIARTELAFAHVRGNIEGWKASGEVVGKRLILGDLHDIADECDEAAEMGVVDLDDDFGGLGNPPLHPRCVCDVLPILSDEGEGE